MGRGQSRNRRCDVSQVYCDKDGYWWVINQQMDEPDFGPYETEDEAWAKYDQIQTTLRDLAKP